MERLLSKRMQLTRESTGTTGQKANVTMKREVNRELKDSSKPSRNGDVVVDPVTGHQTAIHHSPNESQLHSGTNVLQIPLPQPDLAGQKGYLLNLFRVTLMRLGAAYLLIPIWTFFISPPWLTSRPLLLLPLSLVPPSLIAFFLLHRLQRHAHEHEDQQIWNMERQRGLQAGCDISDDGKEDITERVRESAEWFNALLRGVWPIINTDLFTNAVDMLEEIMQASVPKFIHSVRIGDLGQGTNPIRITSIRSLPDAGLSEVMQGLDAGDRELIQGDHVNLEVSFAYRANPATSRKTSRAVNAHLLIEFFMGLRGVIGVPVPVWAEITGAVGTARIRAELIPDPPFVKHTLVTLMGLPKISLSITPLHKKMLPNIMDIPFLSDFISKSINLAAQEYVAPKSMIFDLQTLLSSDGIKRDSTSVGVIIVHIHRCKGLKSTDRRTGSVDAYVSVCMSPMNKPQYSTRVIVGDLNPVFEECTALLVDPNAPKVKERVSLQVWDSDRFTGDDLVGLVEIDLFGLMKNKNQAIRRSACLRRPVSQEHMGYIEYTIGFYAKVAPGSEEGSPGVPQVVLDDPEFSRVKQKSLSDIEAAVTFVPPSRKWSSGILTIQIHEIRELGIKKDRPTLCAKREDVIDIKQEDGAEEVEEDSDLPSGYCTVVMDDEPIYRTRTKPMTASPFFNASTEQFVADWRSSHICLVVRDSRLREVNPILGVVYLKLSELFETSSQVTRTWSLQRGLGFGRIRASFCFRPVLAHIPPALTGFGIGSLEVQSLSPHYNDQSLAGSTQIRLRTSPKRQKLLRRPELESKHTPDSLMENRSSVSLSSIGSGDSEEEFSDHMVNLPVQKRYQSALLVTVKRNSLLQRGTVGVGVVWMKDLIDNRKQVVRAKIWKASDYDPLKRNYLPLWGIWEDPVQEVTCIGEVEMTLCFRPGVADIHETSFLKDANLKRSWEEYVALRGSDLRTNVGRKADERYHEDQSDSNTVVQPEDMDTDGHEDMDSLPRSLRRRGRMGIDRVREWRNHENDLTRALRGIHHVKAVRTAGWMKDHLMESMDAFQDRFKWHEGAPKMGKESRA